MISGGDCDDVVVWWWWFQDRQINTIQIDLKN